MKILIKEVADVVFYEIDKDTGNPSYPVLYLDTLKVSTIEQTAENAEARGGKGNAALISWDYNKEINVTLEDALFSAKSMAIMFGNGQVKDIADSNIEEGLKKLIMKTEQFKATGIGDEDGYDTGWQANYEGPDGKMYKKIHPKFYDSRGAEAVSFDKGETYFCTFDLSIAGAVIEISANSFPGTYYITGDTFARSDISGDDEFFQFIIPKAKVTSENTITLEAEGDPSVFNLNLRVLRPADGKMMKLVKYELVDGETEAEDTKATLIHNHNLTGTGTGETSKELKAAATPGEENPVTGLVSTDQAVFDKDVIADVSFGDGTATITAADDAANGATGSLTIFDRDGKYKGTYTVKVKRGL